MDEIIIENLQIYAYHGVYQEEKEKGQNFYVNAVLYMDAAGPGKEDKRELTTSYGEVCHFIHNFVSSHVFNLIDTALRWRSGSRRRRSAWNLSPCR